MVGVRLGNVRRRAQPVFLQGMRILKKEREEKKERLKLRNVISALWKENKVL